MGEKNWSWIKKGVPLIINVGKRELEQHTLVVIRRDQSPQEKTTVASDTFVATVSDTLSAIQKNYFDTASNFLRDNTQQDVKTQADFEHVFRGDAFPHPFVHAKWCGAEPCQEQAEKLAVTIRCIPFEQRGTEGRCVICANKATLDAVFAKSY